MATPTLETPRLILRPVSLADAPAVQKHFNNWNIIQHLNASIPWPYPDDGAESFIRMCLPKIENGECYIWVLVPKAGPDEAIGIIDFGIGRDHGRGDRGFWLAESYWRQGLMTEAISAVNDFVFDVLKIEKFNVYNHATNHGSHRVKKKTGARFVGYKELPHHNGETKSEIWEVTRESWLAAKNK
jgi:RimJ/RimL family protein N-acetyltransferase